jgi:hypothetical protein
MNIERENHEYSVAWDPGHLAGDVIGVTCPSPESR